MTQPTDPLFDQRIADWLEGDPIDAPNQVLDTVLAALPLIPRRRAYRVPWRFTATPLVTRFAVAAAIGVIAVGGALYVLRPSQPAVGGPSATSSTSSSASSSLSPTVVPAIAPSWTATGSMGTPRRGQSAALLPDGRVLVVGGEPNGPEPASAELYDPTSSSWTAAGRMLGYWGSSLTVLLDGRVLVGTSGLFDPTSGSWTAAGRTKRVHEDAASITLLLDGRVLLAGGHDDRFPPKGVTAAAELYDPATGKWTVTGSMVTARANHTATLLSDGRVLVAGGDDWQDATPSAELYDPVSGTWTATGTMLAKYTTETATRLADGRVLVVGHAVGPNKASGSRSFVSVAELYDPASGSWSSTGPMLVAREGFTATLLLGGEVLVAGGSKLVSGSYDDVDTASAELYDPGTNSWTATLRMLVAREFHTATLLRDGRLLVAGGSSGYWGGAHVASAELYDPGSGK